MVQGRHPKPLTRHLREGTYDHSRHGNRADVIDFGGKPAKLQGLGRDGQWLWNEVVRSCPPGMLARLDSAELFRLCRWWQKYRTADRLYAREPTQKTFSQLKHCSAEFGSLASKFGMTPAARGQLKLSAITPRQDDGLGDLLSDDDPDVIKMNA